MTDLWADPTPDMPLYSPRELLTLCALILGILASTFGAYQLGHTVGQSDARLEAPIECGDPIHPNGIHNRGRLRLQPRPQP